MHGRRDAPETERQQSGKDGAQSDAYEAASFKVHSRTLSNPKDVEPMQAAFGLSKAARAL